LPHPAKREKPRLARTDRKRAVLRFCMGEPLPQTRYPEDKQQARLLPDPERGITTVMECRRNAREPGLY
jgi:hypothetical protein